jgi:protein-L-isoaspartate(D-aspartate) O-methyltransferase
MTDFAALRQRMVDNQVRPNEVNDRDIIRALLGLPREKFVAPSERPFAYADRPLSMSSAAPERRMLEPFVLARLIEALPLGPAAAAMAVGCGTGYSAAILSRLAATVVALEEDAVLAEEAARLLREVGAANVDLAHAGLTEGYPARAPYDAILLEGAVEFVPDTLIGQLRQGGMLATIERTGRTSRAMLYERVGEGASGRPLFEAWASPLPGFQRRPEFVF